MNQANQIDTTSTVARIPENELNKGKVTYLGIFFMILLCSLNSYFQYSSLVFNQMNYSKLGMLSIATFFISSAGGTIYAPWFSRTYFHSYSKKFLVAGLPHCILLFVGIIASRCSDNREEECSGIFLYFIVLASSCICGLGNALLWVLQGAYITDCTSERNKGEFFGIFFQYSQVSNIFGPILSSYLFKNYGTSGYFSFMFLLTLVSNTLAFFVKEPMAVYSNGQDQLRQSEYDQNSNIYFENYKELNEKLVQRNSTLHPTDNEEKLDLTRLKQFLVEKFQIKFYFPLFFLNGFFLGYYWSQIGFLASSKMQNVTDDDKNEKLGIIFLLMGLIQPILGRKLGASFDQMEDKILYYKRVIFVSLLCTVLVIIFYFLNFLWPFYIISAMFGFGELLIKGFIGGALSMKFNDNSYESFAMYRLVSNIASFVAMIISTIFTPEVPLVMMCCLAFNVYTCIIYTSRIKVHLSGDVMFASAHSNY
ncbi:hypothetical protein ABPG72_011478 [Tetrahymena utriculariae]